MVKRCVLYDRDCIDCMECEFCDLDPTKICDNCEKCLGLDGKKYNEVKIDKIILDPDNNELI